MRRLSFGFVRIAGIAAILPAGVALSVAAVAEEAKPAAIEQIIVTAQKRDENVQDVPLAVTALVRELQQPTVKTLVDLNGYAPNVIISSDPSRSGGSSINIRGIAPTRTDDNSFDAPIAVAIDGIFLGTNSGQIVENFDLERVEILRGPQGTLFGKNTTGGVLNVIRSRPTGEWGARVQLDYGEWNQQEARVVVNAPVIKDVLAAKVFYTSLQGDGYLDGKGNTNDMPEQDYQNGGLTLLVTPTEDFEAAFTIEKFKDKSDGGGSLTNYNLGAGVAAPPPPGSPETDLSGGFFSSGLFTLGLPGGPLEGVIPQWDSTVPARTNLKTATSTSVDTENPSEFDVDAYTLNTRYRLNDTFTIATVSGYRDMTEDRLLDFDGSADNFITLSRNNDYDQKSVELRLEGTWDKATLTTGVQYWDSEFTQDWVTGGDFWKYVGSLGGYDLRDNTWMPVVFAPTAVPGWTPADPLFQLNPAPAAFGGPITVSPLEGCFAAPGAAAIAPGSRTPEQAAIVRVFGNTRCDTGTPLTGMGALIDQRLYETQETKAYAAFAQGDWEFIENWTATVGIRYTRETKDFTAGQAYLASVSRRGVDNFPEYVDLDNEWTKWTPKVGVSFRFTPEIMFYASYSEGFHSGGFFGVNQNVADFVRDQYKPEKIGSYEVGMKSQFFENTVQLNVAGFYNKYKDKQESSVQFDPTTNTVATVFDNVADATYQGVELEARWVASEYVSLFASGGYLDAQYDTFETDINPNDNALPGGGVIVDASYLTPTQAPEYTYGLGGTFTYPIGEGRLELFGKYAWVDQIETSLLNLSAGRIDSREDVSASIGYYFRNMSFIAYGRNLTDEVVEFPFPIVPLFAAGTVAPGISWGLTFGIEI
jgi:outer membrane receptor protein involved in Fe transport